MDLDESQLALEKMQKELDQLLAELNEQIINLINIYKFLIKL